MLGYYGCTQCMPAVQSSPKHPKHVEGSIGVYVLFKGSFTFLQTSQKLCIVTFISLGLEDL